MKIIIYFLTIIFLANPSYAAMTKVDAQSAFDRANESYKVQDYETAVEQYLSIIDGGFKSAEIYYNLANSYYKLNQIGKAVVNYDRAYNYDKRDQDIKFNRAYVNAQVVYSSKSKENNLIQQLFKAHTNFYTIKEALLIIMVLIFLLAGIHIGSLYFPIEKKRLNALLTGIFVLIVIFIYGLYFERQENNNSAVILKNTQALFEPTENSTLHFQLKEGVKVKIESEDKFWIRIQRRDGKRGWIKRDTLEEI